MFLKKIHHNFSKFKKLLEMIKNKPSFLKEDAVLHEYERIMENSILKW